MKTPLLAFLLMSLWSSVLAQSCNWKWIRGATGIGVEEGATIAIDIHNNVYITGNFTGDNSDTLQTGVYMSFDSITLNCPNGKGEFFITKYSPSGNVLWAKGSNIGSSEGGNLATDLNGNVYLAGYFNDSIAFDNTHFLTSSSSAGNAFIVKYDSLGNVLWMFKPTGGFQTYISIATDRSGNLYAVGNFDSIPIIFGSYTINPSSGNFFMVKFNQNGTVLWAKTINGPSLSSISGSVGVTDTSNNFYITGAFSSDTINVGGIRLHSLSTSNPFQILQVFSAKFDSTGHVIWAASAGGTDQQIGFGISADASGNSYITGSYQNGTIYFDTFHLTTNSVSTLDCFFTAKYDPTGHVLWVKGANAPGGAFGEGIAAEPDGTIHVAGSLDYGCETCPITFDSITLSQPTTASDPVFVVSYDPNGNVLNVASLPTGGDDELGIAVDRLGDVYVGSDFFQNFSISDGESLTLTAIENILVAKFTCNGKWAEGIENINATFPITVYPNPSTGIFHFNGISEMNKVEVYNILGQHILSIDPYSAVIGSASTIDLSGSPAGVYFYRVTDRGNIIQQGKIVME